MATRRRWVCLVCNVSALGPEKPRKDNIVRYCFDCSTKKGVLVKRVCPTLEAKRTAKIERAAKKRAAKASAAKAKRIAEREKISAELPSKGHPDHNDEFYLGIDLRHLWTQAWRHLGKTARSRSLSVRQTDNTLHYRWSGQNTSFICDASFMYAQDSSIGETLTLFLAMITAIDWRNQEHSLYRRHGSSRQNYKSPEQRTKYCDLTIKLCGIDKEVAYLANFNAKGWSELRRALGKLIDARVNDKGINLIQLEHINRLAKKLGRGIKSTRVLSQRVSLDDKGLVLLDREIAAVPHKRRKTA